MIIALGMPMVGDVPAEIITSRMELSAMIASRSDVEELKVVACLDVFPFDRAREFLITQALKSQSCYLLFLDADIITPKEAFNDLFETMVDKKAQVVSGHYRRRGHPYTSVWAKMNDKAGLILQCDASEGVHEIDTSGLGCSLIDLKWCEDNLAHPWFKMGENLEGDYAWEDSYFHSQVLKAGGKVFGDARVRCIHLAGRLGVSDDNWQVLLQRSTQKQVDALKSREEAVSV